ncbi:carbonic anhydrase [Bacillus cereus]|nr:carbonic anhydrase [Bacillus cereus]
MPKMGNTFLTIQELEKKKEYLLDLSSVIPTWNVSYQFLFKEIQQELLSKVNEKLEKHQFVLNICADQQVGHNVLHTIVV